MTDYRRLYEQYWAQPDSWGTCSFASAERLADEILSVCGGGTLLDAGCGMGLLVQALLRKGVDAQGMDVAQRPVDHLNRIAPGRFHVGSLLQLPFADGAFDTLVCTGVLECIDEADIPRALAEIHRVARRFAFLTVATTPDRDHRWHLSVHGRDWWEERLFQAGFRKHPLAQILRPYESLEEEGTPVTIALERISPAALERYPLAKLLLERDLHMDMLRETGRRADAHVARYQLACRFVRPGDTVLDLACGLGYGSTILASGSEAARVIGADQDPSAIEYAKCVYAPDYPAVEYRQIDAANLACLADGSIDMVVSVETLEHLPAPEGFLAEVWRVLSPGGRLLVSVPNEWVDESGRDPNPHHLHVYSREKLCRQLERHFSVEKLYVQVAGGGMKLSGHPRLLREVAVQNADAPPAEWWIAVASKDPLAGRDIPYQETVYRRQLEAAPDCNAIAFGRDYDNPWLVRAMVSIGIRSVSENVLESLAAQTLTSARPGAADTGAALCITGYRLLAGQPTSERVDAWLLRLSDYHRQADKTPHAWRWRISCQYLAGALLLATGRREPARQAWLQCADMDCLSFSPLLATKTVDSLYLAGLLAACDGNAAEAAALWRRGLRELQRVLQGDWQQIWGSERTPVSFGVPEVAELADLASRCAKGLLMLDDWRRRPGVAWSATARRSLREQGAWNQTLQAANAWLEEQYRRWLRTAQEQGLYIEQLKQWNTKLEEAKAWLEQQCNSWMRASQQRDAQVEQLTQQISNLEEGKAWLEEQCTNWMRATQERDGQIEQLKQWICELEKGKAWLEEQYRKGTSVSGRNNSAGDDGTQ